MASVCEQLQNLNTFREAKKVSLNIIYFSLLQWLFNLTASYILVIYKCKAQLEKKKTLKKAPMLMSNKRPDAFNNG